MTAPLVVGILGAGCMAQGFDTPDAPHVVTLAHAVVGTPGFALGGFYDVNPVRSAEAERTWGCAPSPRERAAWLDQPWDVVCIVTPDEQHGADLTASLERKPKAVVVEKPAAVDPAHAVALLEQAQRVGVPVVVDFPRRWHRGVDIVARHIADGTLGRPLAAVFVYSGAAIHNAVHMIDLFHTWWGGAWDVTRDGGEGSTRRLTFRRVHDTVTATFVSMDPEAYYVWEMHVYCERGKVELAHSPEVLEVSTPAPHPVYATFQVLTPLERLGMEDEPLLSRLFESVARAIDDPEHARAWAQREIDSHTFAHRVLTALEAPCPR